MGHASNDNDNTINDCGQWHQCWILQYLVQCTRYKHTCAVSNMLIPCTVLVLQCPNPIYNSVSISPGLLESQLWVLILTTKNGECDARRNTPCNFTPFRNHFSCLRTFVHLIVAVAIRSHTISNRLIAINYTNEGIYHVGKNFSC
jgi:hypothetical protein